MHLTEAQLNEYLDNAIANREDVEAHLASCADCAARFGALKNLFVEIESLPEVELTRSFAARFITTPSVTPQLPRWLTLTAILQTALALIIVILSAPVINRLLPTVQMPSLTNIFHQLQNQWVLLFNPLSTFRLNSGQAFHLPSLPQLPPFEVSSLMLALMLAGASALWLVGNGLLLRNQR